VGHVECWSNRFKTGHLKENEIRFLTMAMKVCHVCNVHPVDDGRVFHRACKGLAMAGYDVHLFAVGKGKASYSEAKVVVHPLPECQTRHQRFSRRSKVAQMAADLNPDLFHVHEPELLGAVIACAQSKPVIYDVHESYLDVLQEREWVPNWLRPFMRFAWDKWERRLVRRCAGVVVTTERIARRYRRFHGRVQIVSNYPDLSGVEDLAPADRDGKTCVFAGGLSPDRGLSQVLSALAILKRRGLLIPLALAGRAETDAYLNSLFQEADRLDVGDLVRYHGVLSKEEAILFQQRASIGLVPYLPVANSMASMANKLAECMALGLPLVFSNFPNYREIAGASGAGIAVDPTKPQEIADAIEYLVRNPEEARGMGEAGRDAVRERFNWNIEKKKLLALYEQIFATSNTSMKLMDKTCVQYSSGAN
jgi:glycosyltransferase involved in cell wall biosynthesis